MIMYPRKKAVGKKEQALELVEQIADGKWWITDAPLLERAKEIVNGKD